MSIASSSDSDPITTEVLRSGLGEIAMEMHHTLVRSAFNPLLYEVKDFGVGIVSADGELWAEAPGILAFLGPLPETVRTALNRDPPIHFAPGDAFIVNDPYLTGTHISDTTVYMPVFAGGLHVAFAVVTAHWADVGGVTPGGWSPNSTDIFQEGLCFTHQRLSEAGHQLPDMRDLVAANVRFPDVVLGDLDAQIAACEQGARRVTALCDRYGTSTVRSSMRRTIDATEAAMRSRIGELPDGCQQVNVLLDHDGITTDEPFEVNLTVKVSGERLTASFEGTAPTQQGPVNLPIIGTRSQIRAAVKGMLMPDDATNEGHLAAVDFDIAPDLVVNPARPAPCDSYGYVGLGVMELGVRALGRMLPARRVATSYQIFGGYLYRTASREGDPFMFIDPVHGGSGARADADGPTLIFLGDGDTPNTPIEIVEARYPIRCTAYAFRPGSEGAGTYRGGFGLIREFEMLETGVELQINTEGSKQAFAVGLDGGDPGAPSHVEVIVDGVEFRYDERQTAIGPLPKGARVRFLSGGGGGIGDPLRRDMAAVAAEVDDGLLSEDRAREKYGVAVAASGEVDHAATRAVRTATTSREPRPE